MLAYFARRPVTESPLASLLIVKFLEVQINRNKLAVSVVLSLSLHVLLIAMLLWSHPAGMAGLGDSSQGVGQSNGYNVTLISALNNDRDAMSVKAQTPEDIQDLQALEQIAATAPPLAETKLSDMPSLVTDALPDTLSQPKPQSVAQATASGAAGAKGNGGTANDDLWAAIAPCWNRLVDKDTTPVTLDVSFSGTGGLAKPPEIERDPNAPIDMRRLQSEAKAISALAECGSYAMAQGQENVKINFPKP